MVEGTGPAQSTEYSSAPTEPTGKHRRIEIVHESLLSHWPRLVRWRGQDTEGAQLRDELRQAAQVWEQHDHAEDYLWTGAAYLDYLAWRERYPGGLTAREEEFSRATTAHAERHRRRLRMAVAATMIALLSVLAIVGTFWRRSVREARKAEAAKLLTLAQLHLEEDPTEALAYTTASLELDDTEEARLFALRCLWEAPPALELAPGGSALRLASFSPDDSRLAVSGHSAEVIVFDADGHSRVVLPGHVRSAQGPTYAEWLSNQLLLTGVKPGQRVRIWSFPGGKLVREIPFESLTWWQVGKAHLLAEVVETDESSGHQIFHLRSWRLPGGEPEELGSIDRTELQSGPSLFDADGGGWVYVKGSDVFYRPLPVRQGAHDRLVGTFDNDATFGRYPYPDESESIWFRDAITKELRLWSLKGPTSQPLDVVKPPPSLEAGSAFGVDRSRRWLIEDLWSSQAREARLWDRNAWPEARPLRLRRRGSWSAAVESSDPKGEWLTVSTAGQSRMTFWPLRHPRPIVVDGYVSWARALAFSPDARWLATSWKNVTDTLRLWPLPGTATREPRSLTLPEERMWTAPAFDPEGRYLFVAGGPGDQPFIVPLDGSNPRGLESFSEDAALWDVAVSPSGRQVATAHGTHRGEKTLRVWDVETGRLRLYDLPQSESPSTSPMVGGVSSLAFVDESTLYTAGDGGVSRWDLQSGSHEFAYRSEPGYSSCMALDGNRRTALIADMAHENNEFVGPAKRVDLVTGEATNLPTFGSSLGEKFPVGLDRAGKVAATGDLEGIVRVGRPTDDEPHLLVGHRGAIDYVAVSPDGRWVASTGEDNTLRLWPVPDLDQPPLHTLPHDELLAKLRSLTNIRVVRNPDSPRGWEVRLDPFPGWEEAPEW